MCYWNIHPYVVIPNLQPGGIDSAKGIFILWKYLYTVTRPCTSFLSFQLFLGNCKCTLTGIKSSFCPQEPQNSSGVFKGSFLAYIQGGIEILILLTLIANSSISWETKSHFTRRYTYHDTPIIRSLWYWIDCWVKDTVHTSILMRYSIRNSLDTKFYYLLQSSIVILCGIDTAVPAWDPQLEMRFKRLVGIID